MLYRKDFFFLRHAETVANAENWSAGRYDTSLTEKGRQRAASLAPLFKTLNPKPTCIITSSLSRTKETAVLINTEIGLPMFENADLVEQDYGDFRGKDRAKILEQYGTDWFLNPPNGESYDRLKERALTATNRILEYEKGRVLFVGHGGIMGALTASILDGRIRGLKNCTLFYFNPVESDGWEISEMTPTPTRFESRLRAKRSKGTDFIYPTTPNP